jgi:hypothetical protein
MQRYSLVLYAQDKDHFKVFLNDSISTYNTPVEWWKIGNLQSIRFTAKVNEYIPNLSADFAGLRIEKCETPDLSEGVNILIEKFVTLGAETFVPTIGNILIRRGSEALGCVQSVRFEASVYETPRLVLEGIRSEYFHERMSGFNSRWVEELPEWIIVKRRNLDILQEVGTEGTIDSLSENVTKKK